MQLTRLWLVALAMLIGCSAKPDGIKSSDPFERREALRELGKSAYDTSIAQRLITVLHDDPDEFVRGEAAYALGKLGGPESVRVLVEAAQSLDTVMVRGAAIDALDKMRDPQAIPGLIALWRLRRNSLDWGSHLVAQFALIHLGRRAIVPLLDVATNPTEDQVTRNTAMRTLRRMLEPADETPTDEPRLAVLGALRQITNHDRSIIRMRVRPLLDDPNQMIRRQAALLLGVQP